MIFPDVNRKSFSALKRYLAGKSAPKTVVFLETIWSVRARTKMMIITQTTDIHDLAEWLTDKDNEVKLNIIKKQFN